MKNFLIGILLLSACGSDSGSSGSDEPKPIPTHHVKYLVQVDGRPLDIWVVYISGADKVVSDEKVQTPWSLEFESKQGALVDLASGARPYMFLDAYGDLYSEKFTISVTIYIDGEVFKSEKVTAYDVDDVDVTGTIP